MRISDGIEVFRYPLSAPAAGVLAHFAEYLLAVPASLDPLSARSLRGLIDVVHACNPPDLLFPIGWHFLKLPAPPSSSISTTWGPSCRRRREAAGGRYTDCCSGRNGERTELPTAVVIATNETYRRIAIDRGACRSERSSWCATSPDPARLHPDAAGPDAEGRAPMAGRLPRHHGTPGRRRPVRAGGGSDCLVAPRQVRFAAIGAGDQLGAAAGADGATWPAKVTSSSPVASRMRTLRRYLATAEVGVSPDPANGFNEFCTMNKTLEYMAMGLPIAAFDLEETRVSAADAAVYARPNDPQDLADNIADACWTTPALGARMARTGQGRTLGLSWR